MLKINKGTVIIALKKANQFVTLMTWSKFFQGRARLVKIFFVGLTQVGYEMGQGLVAFFRIRIDGLFQYPIDPGGDITLIIQCCAIGQAPLCRSGSALSDIRPVSIW